MSVWRLLLSRLLCMAGTMLIGLCLIRGFRQTESLDCDHVLCNVSLTKDISVNCGIFNIPESAYCHSEN